MTAAVAMIIVLISQSPAGENRAPPLSPEQVTQLHALMRECEAQNAALRAELEEAQRQLTEAYSSFELDEEKITALQRRIGEVQQELLLNYRRLQVGFRKVVGPERFRILQKRLRPFLQSLEEPARKPEGASKAKRAND